MAQGTYYLGKMEFLSTKVISNKLGKCQIVLGELETRLSDLFGPFLAFSATGPHRKAEAQHLVAKCFSPAQVELCFPAGLTSAGITNIINKHLITSAQLHHEGL